TFTLWSVLLVVDLHAPFSHIREWPSPGRRRKSTSERAVRLAKSPVMALMCTTGACGCAETLVMASVFLGPGPVHETRRGRNGAVGRDESVLSFRQCGFRLLR